MVPKTAATNAPLVYIEIVFTKPAEPVLKRSVSVVPKLNKSGSVSPRDTNDPRTRGVRSKREGAKRIFPLTCRC